MDFQYPGHIRIEFCQHFCMRGERVFVQSGRDRNRLAWGPGYNHLRTLIMYSLYSRP